jgi:polysaccharide biosynthesis protein PslG
MRTASSPTAAHASRFTFHVSRLIFLMLASFSLLLARGAEIPPPILPGGVGVNIHFVTGHERELDMIAAAGFKFIRMDFHWNGIEPKKGQYDWSGYEQLLANLDKRGLRAIFILDYSNPLYEETVTSPHPITGKPDQMVASPQHPESVAAFARWAAAAAKHFQGRHVLWEIWNEPNGHFWSPKPDVHQYATLALATCKAIRDADPQAAIIGPASAGFPWEFLEMFLKSGVLEYVDAVSVHPYRNPQTPPETAAAEYHKLKSMIERYAPPARKGQIPILSGEWGYSTFKRGVSLETQAAFAARQQLSNLLNGVPLSIWYDWKNDGPDLNENEHNFGTVLPDLKPKPAYMAIQTLTRELASYRIVRRLDLPGDKDYALLCTNEAGQQKLAAWTLGDPHSVSLEITLKGNAKLTLVTSNGKSTTPRIDTGRLVLDLVSAPQYVTLGTAVLK